MTITGDIFVIFSRFLSKLTKTLLHCREKANICANIKICWSTGKVRRSYGTGSKRIGWRYCIHLSHSFSFFLTVNELLMYLYTVPAPFVNNSYTFLISPTQLLWISLWHHSTYCITVRTIFYTVHTIHIAHCTHSTFSLFPCFRCWGFIFNICSHSCSHLYKFTWSFTYHLCSHHTSP